MIKLIEIDGGDYSNVYSSIREWQTKTKLLHIGQILSLSSKTFKSALWMMVRMAGRQLANAVLFFWLAALLSPADLGLAALATTLPVFLLTMVTRGIRDAIIQRPEINDEILDSAFLANTLLGLMIMGIIFLSAPLVGQLYGDPRLTSLSLLASTIPFLAALGNPQEALCERNFQHKRISLIYLVTSLLGVGAAVYAVLGGHEIWALVVFNLCAYGLTTLLLWLTSDWHPKGCWSWAEMIAQGRFATPVIISQTISTGNQRIIEMLIGALLTPGAVAFFRFGSNFTRLLNQIVITPVIQVLMPAFARSSTEPEMNLYRALVVNSTVLFPVFLGMAAVLPDFVEAAFSEEWALAGWVGMILCYSVFPSLIGPAAYPLLIVKHKGYWTAWLSSATLVVSVICVVIGAQFGTLGAAVGFVLRGLLTIPMTLWVLKRALDIRPGRILASFLPFAILALVIHGVLLALPTMFPSLSIYLDIALKLLLGLVAYLIGLTVFVRRITPIPYATLKKTIAGPLRRFF